MRRFFLFSLAGCLFFLAAEGTLRWSRGAPEEEPLPSDFEFQYEDIYEPFFKKVRNSDGSKDWVSQRKRVSPQRFSVHKWNPALLESVRGKQAYFKNSLAENAWARSLVPALERRWPVILWHEGESFRARGDYPMALMYFNDSVAAGGERDCQPHLRRALVYEAAGDTQETLAAWRMARRRCRGRAEFEARRRRVP